jgi:hypothetical protein
MKRGVLVLSTLLLGPVLAVRSVWLARDVVDSVHRLRTDDFEERRIESYGDCDRRGYGYVRRVLRRFPDAGSLPRIHYGDTDLFAAHVIPELRFRQEPRVFIGIGMDWSQTRETSIRIDRDASRPSASAWAFAVLDTDLLTGLRVSVADDAAVPRALDVTLYGTPARTEVLGRWTLVVPAGGREAVVRLVAPVEQFSVKRGGVDFVIDIRGGAVVSRIDLLVVPIDARGLVVVQREGACLTAVETGLLGQIERGPGPWAGWLADLKGPR